MAFNGRIRERLYYPARLFAVVGDAGFGTGVPAITQVTSRQDIGFEMLVGDDVSISMNMPIFVDPEQDIGLRINWTTGSSTSADTIDWTQTFEFIDEDAQLPTTIGKPLDTVIAQDTVGAATAFLNKWTSRGIIAKTNSNLPTRANMENGTRMLFKTVFTATNLIDTAAEKVWFLGLEMDFVRRDFIGTTGVDEALSSIPT